MISAFTILHDGEVTIVIKEGYPPVVNTDIEVELAGLAANELLGEGGVK